MAKQTIALDFGSSDLKGFHGSNGSEPVKHIILESEYLTLPSSFAEQLPKDAGMGSSLDSAWVKLKKQGDCHLIGFTAKEYQAQFNFGALKINSIVPKTLAILASIHEERPIEEYSLSLLVPLNESSAAAQLKQNLVKHLKNFYFRQQRLSLPIDPAEIFIAPEGTGVAMLDREKSSLFQKRVCGYLMLGYNHAAIIVFKQGRFALSLSKIERLGFVRLVELMQQRIPELDKDAVKKAMFTTASATISYTNCDWSKITPDVDRYQKIYLECKDAYWQSLSLWLHNCLSFGSVDSIVRCGGTSDLLSDRLNQFFQAKNIPVYAPKDYNNVMLQALGFEDLNTSAARSFIKHNPMRFADVWGLFATLSGYQYDRVTKINSTSVRSKLPLQART